MLSLLGTNELPTQGLPSWHKRLDVLIASSHASVWHNDLSTKFFGLQPAKEINVMQSNVNTRGMEG